MNRKKTLSEGDHKQLGLPFTETRSTEPVETNQDNIVCLSQRLNERIAADEIAVRQRSINRLINYANRLNWP